MSCRLYPVDKSRRDTATIMEDPSGSSDTHNDEKTDKKND